MRYISEQGTENTTPSSTDGLNDGIHELTIGTNLIGLFVGVFRHVDDFFTVAFGFKFCFRIFLIQQLHGFQQDIGCQPVVLERFCKRVICFLSTKHVINIRQLIPFRSVFAHSLGGLDHQLFSHITANARRCFQRSPLIPLHLAALHGLIHHVRDRSILGCSLTHECSQRSKALGHGSRICNGQSCRDEPLYSVDHIAELVNRLIGVLVQIIKSLCDGFDMFYASWIIEELC